MFRKLECEIREREFENRYFRFQMIIPNFPTSVLENSDLNVLKSCFNVEVHPIGEKTVIQGDLSYILRNKLEKYLARVVLKSDLGEELYLNYQDEEIPRLSYRQKYAFLDLLDVANNFNFMFLGFLERIRSLKLVAREKKGLVMIYGFEELERQDRNEYLDTISSLKFYCNFYDSLDVSKIN